MQVDYSGSGHYDLNGYVLLSHTNITKINVIR